MKNLKIEELSTQQKLGMLLCARAWGNLSQEELDFILEKIRNHALGSVQVSWKQPELMEKIRAAADYPIIIITDMEMGCPGSELPPVPAMTLSACDKPEYYRAFARSVVSEGKKRGFNGAWSPDIDILDADGPCKVFRRLSDDPERVAKTAEEISRVFAENGFLSCGKHYPCGSRVVAADNHMTRTWAPETEEQVVDFWLKPYLHLMEKGLLPSVMVGHYDFPNIDPEFPSSLSKKIIDLIRDRGFDGVIWTDDFGMMSILQRYGEENVIGMAIAAGNDIVLPNYNTPTQRHFELLERNYADGAFTEERLNDAVRHVLAAQAIVADGMNCPDPLTAEDLECYNNIAKDCITAITDPGVDAALPKDNTDRLFVIIDNKVNPEPSQETIARDFYFPEEIEKKIHAEFPEAEVVYLPEFPNSKDNEKVLVAATRHKEVVFITYCNTRPFLGTDCLTRRAEAVINALIMSDKVSAVVHFGNPFALKPLRHVKRKLFGYMMPQSQLYAIEVLAGKLSAPGKLPYNIQFE